ncbi:type II toxin-antitoxin system VapC family toxin [Rhizobium leguminosarum]|nr:type II toxin-antitoxin system VapC family toxin [Rhizobium leguminosarum]MBY5908547.1 type II toxin-antitoxin system VapC family toxin [Rhizobium leguminosarum]
MASEKDEEAVDSFIAYTATCMVVSLDTTLARRAAEITATHKFATADTIIYATAEHHDADILPCDAHFKDLERAIPFDKKTYPHVTQALDGAAQRFYHKMENGNLASEMAENRHVRAARIQWRK